MGFKIENGVLKKYTVEPGVTEVVILDGVTSIGDSAFEHCSSLTAVTIPDSVTSIGREAFDKCKSLTNVTIGNSVTSIGNWAFKDCRNLTAVTIGNSVTSIGDRAFDGTPFYENDKREFVIYGKVLYKYKGNKSNVTIHDSVTSIGDSAFWGCSKLKKIPAFGYVIDGSSCNWDKVDSSDVRSMLHDKNYAVKMDRPTKFQFVAQVFLKDRQPEAEAYIKKNISKILPYFIGIDDYATVKGLLEHGKFVTKRNIMKFIDYAIEHTQNGGDMQIQVLLMNYKNDNFPDMDPLKSIKF